MFRDGREVAESSTVEVDLCIIGAGAAGITLARAIKGRGFRVAVLESGPLTYHDPTQSLYQGKVEGQGYPSLDGSRLRYFGGTTNHWSGYCRPMKVSDFDQWPIDARAIAPFETDAFAICQLGRGNWNWDESFWRRELGAETALFADSAFECRITQITPDVTPTGRSFGEFFRDEVERAEDVTVFLWSNVVEFERFDAENAIASVTIGTLDGPSWRVVAKCFVLACGGIENARLLLASNSQSSRGIGNENDLVGRFFADHVYFPSCRLITAEWDALLDETETAFGRMHTVLAAADEEHDPLVNPFFYMYPAQDPFYEEAAQADGLNSLRELYGNVSRGILPRSILGHLANIIGDADDLAWLAYAKLRHGGIPANGREGLIVLNTVPDPANRVTLLGERDALGMPRAHLRWRLGEREWRAATRTTNLLAREVGRLGIGRVQLLATVEQEVWPDDLGFGYHHVGTTRMGATERDGVVDADCRVHGLRNLYVAGSSVFPSHGSGTPTLTIVALALRLAKTLEQRLTEL